MVNLYRLNHPEYREAEKVKDRENKKNKYQTDPEYREKVKERNKICREKKKIGLRPCRECEKEIEYIPRRVFCVDCYKKIMNSRLLAESATQTFIEDTN